MPPRLLPASKILIPLLRVRLHYRTSFLFRAAGQQKFPLFADTSEDDEEAKQDEDENKAKREDEEACDFILERQRRRREARGDSDMIGDDTNVGDEDSDLDAEPNAGDDVGRGDGPEDGRKNDDNSGGEDSDTDTKHKAQVDLKSRLVFSDDDFFLTDLRNPRIVTKNPRNILLYDHEASSGVESMRLSGTIPQLTLSTQSSY